MKIFKGNKKKLFIVDGESDSLYGEIFAIAAVVADIETLEIVDTFAMYNKDYLDLKTNKLRDEWCRDNVVPAILKSDSAFASIYFNYELRDKFWDFYETHREESIVIADFAAPVEAALFKRCVLDMENSRRWNAPYPLHELGTMLLMKGLDPDIDRTPYYLKDHVKHNPLHDVYSSLELIKRENLLD